MAPKPPTFGTPRQSRGAPLSALLNLSLDDCAPPAKQEVLQAPEQQIEPETEDTDHRGSDEHPVHEEIVPRLLDAIAQPAVGSDQLRRHEHEESQGEPQPQPDDDPGQRRPGRDVRKDLPAIGAERERGAKM